MHSLLSIKNFFSRWREEDRERERVMPRNAIPAVSVSELLWFPRSRMIDFVVCSALLRVRCLASNRSKSWRIACNTQGKIEAIAFVPIYLHASLMLKIRRNCREKLFDDNRRRRNEIAVSTFADFLGRLRAQHSNMQVGHIDVGVFSFFISNENARESADCTRNSVRFSRAKFGRPESFANNCARFSISAASNADLRYLRSIAQVKRGDETR